MIRAVLFDLDETLILDEPVVKNAFLYTAKSVTQDHQAALVLAKNAAKHTTRLWDTLPPLALEYAKRIGHSAFEGLWAVYNPDIPAEALLNQHMGDVRHQIWEEALLESGLSGDPEALSWRWADLRSRYPLYPDADELLSSLYGRYKLGLVTNGVAGLQRKKWHGSGLETWFDAVAISGEVGIGKPERGIFEWVANDLGVALEECVMVGDNADRDVLGGKQAGMKTIWLERGFKPQTVQADFACKNLLEVLLCLKGL
jgi:HAD superfamily hydrolase (TIGR01549 family)